MPISIILLPKNVSKCDASTRVGLPTSLFHLRGKTLVVSCRMDVPSRGLASALRQRHLPFQESVTSSRVPTSVSSNDPTNKRYLLSSRQSYSLLPSHYHSLRIISSWRVPVHILIAIPPPVFITVNIVLFYDDARLRSRRSAFVVENKQGEKGENQNK